MILIERLRLSTERTHAVSLALNAKKSQARYAARSRARSQPLPSAPQGLPEKQFNGKNKNAAAKEKTALLQAC